MGESLVGAVFTGLGLMHAFQVSGNDIDYLFNLDRLAALVDPAARLGMAGPAPEALTYRAFPLAFGYLLLALAFFGFGAYAARHPDSEMPE